MQRIALAICVTTLALFSSADAEIYKWTDEHGHVHYGDDAPRGVDAVEVSERLKDAATIYTPPPAPASPPSSTRDGSAWVQTPEEKSSGRITARPVDVDINLVEYTLSKGDEKKIRQEIELMYRWFVDRLGWSPRPKNPVKIRIFGSAAAFNAYVESVELWSIGRSHYSLARREVVMRGTQWTEETIGTLRHEVAHAILHMEVGAAPSWINEGLAEVFRSSGALRGRLNVTPNPEWVEIMKLKLREGSLEPMNRYLTIPNGEWRTQTIRVERSYYMIAWSMMSFLLSTPHGQTCLRGVISDARKTGFSDLDQRFERHCGNSKWLDAQWRAWVDKL